MRDLTVFPAKSHCTSRCVRKCACAAGELSLAAKGVLKDLIVDQDARILGVAEAFEKTGDLADVRSSFLQRLQLCHVALAAAFAVQGVAAGARANLSRRPVNSRCAMRVSSSRDFARTDFSSSSPLFLRCAPSVWNLVPPLRRRIVLPRLQFSQSVTGTVCDGMLSLQDRNLSNLDEIRVRCSL